MSNLCAFSESFDVVNCLGFTESELNRRGKFRRFIHTRQPPHVVTSAFATCGHGHDFGGVHRCILSCSEGYKISRRDGYEGMSFYDKRLFRPCLRP